MAIEYTPNDVGSGYNLSKLNENFTKAEASFEDGLSRSGQGPNQMEADLDMNSNDILNVDFMDAHSIDTDQLVLNGQIVHPVDIANHLSSDDFATTEEAIALTPNKVMTPGTTYDMLEYFQGGEGTTYLADVASTINVVVSNPKLNSKTGTFILDQQDVANNAIVFLSGQNDGRQNGFWVYDKVNNVLNRPTTFFTAGSTQRKPLYAEIATGDELGGTTFALSTPARFIVDTEASVWVDNSTGQGGLDANTVVAGPYLPFYGRRQSSPRQLSSNDQPTYKPSVSVTSFPQSVYANLNNFGYVSRYIQYANPWDNTGAMNALIKEHNVIIFDTAVYLGSQISAALSNKRMIFNGRRSRVNVLNPGNSFLNISGVSNFRIEGDCYVEKIQRATAGTVRCIIGSTTQNNIRISSLECKNFERAIDLAGAVDGFEVERIKVADTVLDRHIIIASTVTGNKLYTKIGKTLGIPIKMAQPANTNVTYRTAFDSPVVDLTGTLTANRIVTLSLENAYDGAEAVFKRTGGGSFSWDIGGLKTLATAGLWAKVVFDGSSNAWVLVETGSL